MSGGDEWEQRGIIPRVLSYIFEQFEKFKNKYKYELRVSYIEIYNEHAYDLLS
jgi:kinesin family protein 6/9